MKRKRYKLWRSIPTATWLYALLQFALWSAGSVNTHAQPTPLVAAVAANFAPALRDIAHAFEQETGIAVTVVSGSTGKHYAQIRQGAPFDVFFAADQRRPQLLEQAGAAVAGSRFTYATGRLVLWSRHWDRLNVETLRQGEFQHLAIANPRLAPYGAAAEAALVELGLWQSLQPKLVRAENINQAYQFVDSGAAELGLVALAQLQPPTCDQHSACWLVPEEMHPAIEQQALIVTPSAAAQQLMRFVQSARGQAIIRRHGYQTGQPDPDQNPS